MSDSTISFQQRHAADLFVGNGLKAYQAMVEAGYSESYARARCGDFFERPEIQAYLKRQYGPILLRCGLTVELVIRRLVLIAGANLSQVVEWGADGKLRVRPSNELNPDETCIIESIESDMRRIGDVKSARLKVKAASAGVKLEALRELRHYLNAFGMIPAESEADNRRENCGAGREGNLMDPDVARGVIRRLGPPRKPSDSESKAEGIGVNSGGGHEEWREGFSDSKAG